MQPPAENQANALVPVKTRSQVILHFSKWWLLLTVVYTITAVLGLQWATANGLGSPIWPAAGVALAGLVLGGLPLASSIFIGTLAGYFIVGSEHPLWVKIILASGNMLAGMAGAYLLRRFKFNTGFNTMQDALGFILIAVAVGFISTFIGVGTLSLSMPLSSDGRRDRHPDFRRLHPLLVCKSGRLIVMVVTLYRMHECNQPRQLGVVFIGYDTPASHLAYRSSLYLGSHGVQGTGGNHGFAYQPDFWCLGHRFGNRVIF
jgi:hypothetical protein